MKILVGFKRVIDYHITARPTADGKKVELNGVKMAPNPFDEIALEEALRLRDAGHATEVVALGIGPEQTKETLRTALAMGADRAIHVPHPTGELEALEVAKAFQAIAQAEGAGLILLGKQAIDSDNGQTPSMVAELLGWPQALNAYKITLDGDKASVVTEIDGGLETFGFTLPAVISVDLRLNEPRFVKMPDIIKARSKPIDTVEHAFAESRVTLSGVFVPPQERKKEILETVDALMTKLEGSL